MSKFYTLANDIKARIDYVNLANFINNLDINANVSTQSVRNEIFDLISQFDDSDNGVEIKESPLFCAIKTYDDLYPSLEIHFEGYRYEVKDVPEIDSELYREFNISKASSISKKYFVLRDWSIIPDEDFISDAIHSLTDYVEPNKLNEFTFCSTGGILIRKKNTLEGEERILVTSCTYNDLTDFGLREKL